MEYIMNRFIVIALSALVFFVSASPVSAKKPPQVETFNCNNYSLIPPSLADSVAPSTTIIIDSSGSMNEHAYQEVEVQWRDFGTTTDRRAYTGFNSTNEYYGYFDPFAYYSYNSTGDWFYPDTSGEWSGNFMNWVSMHRTDIVRKVLTGGPYDNSTSPGTYTVSRTDGGVEFRGRYHVFDTKNTVTDLNNATKHVVPSAYRNAIGFEQQPNDDLLRIYNSTIDTMASPVRWTMNTTQLASFTLRVASEKKFGVLDRFGYRMRLALFRYDNDGTLHNGGKILNYMTSDPTEIATIINNINFLSVNSWTPLAETLHTVVGYVQQVSEKNTSVGPRYEDSSYNATKGKAGDPFFFSDLNATIHCTQQNVILITDGESTKDIDVPAKFKTAEADVAGNDAFYAAQPDDASGYLENIAYWAHTNDLRDDLPGKQTINLYTVFAFGSGSQLLKDAAKWGGFIDRNGDGLPDPDEYDANNDGVPDNYFEAASGSALEDALVVTFSSILNRVSSGSAASVVNTSREGVGFLSQAVYWPELRDLDGKIASWAGDVYAYWLDEEGNMHEDNGTTKGQFDASDGKLTIWYDTFTTPNRARACSGGKVVNGTCVGGVVKEINSVKHLWAVSKWLNKLPDPTTQRSSTDFLSDNDRRYIKTWKDNNGNGAVNANEVVSFTSANFTSPLVDNQVVNWLRGQNSTTLRPREVRVDTNSDGIADSTVTWRLGDVINSSPTVVSRPAENFDLVWDDPTYKDFYLNYFNRRTMIYFGGNDGMLHAINGGFYSEDNKSYCRQLNTNGSCVDSGLELGAEMWAYVPFNAHPHLSCLADKQYRHQYLVDLKPKVFEVQIFEKDLDHPNGWGTILVTGFKFGGDGQQDLVRDSQYFGSSFFIFDITNPEKTPTFLGEFTYDGEYTLGYAINEPTVVAVKDSVGEKHWYMLMGTGPLTPAGSSTQKAQVIVVPLKQLVSTTNTANPNFSLRLDDDKTKPTMTKMGVLSLSDSNSAMGTGFAAVDYNFDFFVDMMYYGTVVTPNNGPMTGGVHRLKIEAEPDPSKWERKEMTNTGGPMTGGINVGFKNKNVWVYFGTGKFWDVSDKTDLRTQWLYGIMEPKKTNSNAYNFSQIPVGSLLDVTDFYVRPDGLGTLFCKSTNSTTCLPSGVVTVEDLEKHIRDTPNIDGWRRALPTTGERVLVEPSLFGGITNFVTSVPSNDYCVAGGSSKLYALYYLTGTAWKENVFGDASGDYVPFIVDLGQGIFSRPSLHLGKQQGVKLYFQNNLGEIIVLHQPVLPTSLIKSGKGGWHTMEVD
jgi:type IV pilus assembly protein PilY1